MSRSEMISLHFTLRAVSDLEEILTFSTEQFGERAADKYFATLNAAIERIRSNPELLIAEPGFHQEFRFYRANKHLIVCDVSPKLIIVLTIISTSMDIPQRLLELSPALKLEVVALNTRLRQS